MYRQTPWFLSILVVSALPIHTAAQPGAVQGEREHRRIARGDGHAPAQGPPLTLDAALTEALAKNPELIPAQERFLAPPTFEAQIWQWPINTLNPTDTNMYMFMFGQDIPGPGKRRLREAVAQKDVQLADTDIAVRARGVVDSVKRAYVEVFVARKAMEIHHASVDLLRQLADAAQAKYTTGRISQQDVLKAVVELSRVHDHLITLNQQAQLAEAQLNSLLDRPPGGAVGPLADPHERVLLPSSETLQELALQHQPELTMARLGAERAEARLAVVNRDYKPDFFATGGYMLMPDDNDAWMAKVGMTWPTAPWSRGRLDAQRAEATAGIVAASAGVRAVENALRLAVHRAYVRVKAAEQRAALLRTTVVPQAEQTLEVSRVAYQTDRVDFLAIIDNERVRLDAQLDYFRSLTDLEQALADLERAVGTDITPSMAPVKPQGAQ
jgi:cobalt-zinc-cadmium efflux system outer membrane protein